MVYYIDSEEDTNDICDLHGDTVTQEAGYITSPSYPGQYPHNSNCKVTITHGNENCVCKSTLFTISSFSIPAKSL